MQSDNIKSCRDTQFFSRLSPAVFQTILDVIPAIGAVLNWEPLACAFLADVLRQVALTGDPLKKKHIDFARVLWGEELSLVAAARRIGRAIQSLKKCQMLSGFQAVWIDSGGKKGEEYFDTTYRLRDFFDVFSEIQKLSSEQDLMSLPKNQRKITLLAIVQSVCDARGYQKCPKRSRQKSEKTDAKKSASLPCNCNCASCVLCSAKNSATASEANGRVASPQGERVTRESVEKELHALNDRIFECGQRWMNLGLKLDDFNGKVHRDYADMIRRLAGAVKRANAPSVRLVGGQPK